MSTPGKGTIRIDEFGEHVQLEAHVAKVVDCANDLVQSLLHQIRSHTTLHCKLTLALNYKFSKHDSFPLSLSLALHVSESILEPKLILTRGFINQIPGHLFLFIF